MSTFDGRTSYAEYDNFKVSSSADNYRLVSIGTYRGTAGRLNYTAQGATVISGCKVKWANTKIVTSLNYQCGS